MSVKYYFFLESLREDHPQSKTMKAIQEAYEVCNEGVVDSVIGKAMGLLKSAVGDELAGKIQSGIKAKGLQFKDLHNKAKKMMNDPEVLVKGQKLLNDLTGKKSNVVTESVLFEASGIKKYVMALLLVLQVSGALSAAYASDAPAGGANAGTELSSGAGDTDGGTDGGDNSKSVAYGKHIAKAINTAVGAADGPDDSTRNAMSKAIQGFNAVEKSEGNDAAKAYGNTVLDNIENEKAKSLMGQAFGKKLDASSGDSGSDNASNDIKSKKMSLEEKLKAGHGGGGYEDADGNLDIR